MELYWCGGNQNQVVLVITLPPFLQAIWKCGLEITAEARESETPAQLKSMARLRVNSVGPGFQPERLGSFPVVTGSM